MREVCIFYTSEFGLRKPIRGILLEMILDQCFGGGKFFVIFKKALEKIPGLNFNNKRTQIIAAFEEQVRKGFQIRSSRLLNELNTFVYINGRPDHMKGSHDDAIMSMSMALYAGDICFNQLQRNTAKNVAMMESWTLSERTYEPQKSYYSYGSSFDQIGRASCRERV